MILILEARDRPLLGLARGLMGEVTVARDVDLASMKSVRAAVAEVKPKAIVMTGGLEDPIACEEDTARAFVLNAEGAIHLAAAALEFRAVPVLISTAAVFGDAGGEFGEDAFPSPTTAYGRSKRQGESFLLRAAQKPLIVRVGQVLEDGLSRERAVAEISASDRELVSVIGAYDLGVVIENALANETHGLVHAANGNVDEASLWRAIGVRVSENHRKGGAALLCSRIPVLRSWESALAEAGSFAPPAPPDPVHSLAPGEAISGAGPVSIVVRAGKVVVESESDQIVRSGHTVDVSSAFRIVAIDGSEIVLGKVKGEG